MRSRKSDSQHARGEQLGAALEAFRDGADPDRTFEALFRLVVPFVRHLVRRAGGGGEGHSIDDVVQEIMVRVYQSRQKTFPIEPSAFLRWLKTVVQNDARSRWRARGRHKRAGDRHQRSLSAAGPSADVPVGEGIWKGDSGSPEIGVLAAERDALLYAAIQELPLQQRRILGLRARLGLTESEIAEVMDISVNTVRAHRQRAFRHLRSRLGEASEDVERRRS